VHLNHKANTVNLSHGQLVSGRVTTVLNDQDDKNDADDDKIP